MLSSVLLANLRNDMKDLLLGVENSNGWSSWDTTRPNWSYKRQVHSIASRLIDDLKQRYDMEMLHSYQHCWACRELAKNNDEPVGSEKWYEYMELKGLIKEAVYYEKLKIYEKSTCYEFGQRQQCSCGVTEAVLTSLTLTGNDVHELEQASQLFFNISEILDACKERKVRSGIREEIMLFILELEEMILGDTMDEIIRQRVAIEEADNVVLMRPRN